MWLKACITIPDPTIFFEKENNQRWQRTTNLLSLYKDCMPLSGYGICNGDCQLSTWQNLEWPEKLASVLCRGFVLLDEWKEPLTVSGIISWTRNPDWRKVEKASWALGCTHYCPLFLIMETMQPAPSSSCHYNFSAVMGSDLELWSKINSSPLSCLIQDTLSQKQKDTQIDSLDIKST